MAVRVRRDRKRGGLIDLLMLLGLIYVVYVLVWPSEPEYVGVYYKGHLVGVWQEGSNPLAGDSDFEVRAVPR